MQELLVCYLRSEVTDASLGAEGWLLLDPDEELILEAVFSYSHFCVERLTLDLTVQLCRAMIKVI